MDRYIKGVPGVDIYNFIIDAIFIFLYILINLKFLKLEKFHKLWAVLSPFLSPTPTIFFKVSFPLKTFGIYFLTPEL